MKPRISASSKLKKFRFAGLIALSLGLFSTAQAQLTLNLAWNTRSLYQSSGLDTRVTYYYLTPSLQLVRYGQFTNARIVNPAGESGLFTQTTGGFSGSGLTSTDLLAQSITGLWTLTTDFGLQTARNYTFSLSVDAIALQPLYFTAPQSFTGLSDPLKLVWAGAVNDGPLVLNLDGINPLNDQRINLPSGTTEWTGPAAPDLYAFTIVHASFRPVDFVTVTAPIDENGNGIPVWSVTERATAGASTARPLQPVPEPSTWAAGAFLGGSLMMVARRRRQKAQAPRCRVRASRQLP